MVNVYDCTPEQHGWMSYDGNNPAIVGRVKYNDRLDYWDGHNMGNGGTGMHKGITRLAKSGRMVIIIGTQWQGCKDNAYVVSDEQAVRECLESGHSEIIEEYPQLKKVADAMETE